MMRDSREVVLQGCFQNRELAIWGTGGASRRLMLSNLLMRELTSYFIDNDISKRESLFYGKKVFHSSDIDYTHSSFIIVAGAYTRVIIRQLEREGLKEGVDFLKARAFYRFIEECLKDKSMEEKEELKCALKALVSHYDLKDLRRMIADPAVKVVSFNLENVLVSLPVMKYINLYRLVTKKINGSNYFAEARSFAEEALKNGGCKDISIGKIYDKMIELFDLEEDEAEKYLKEEEKIVREYYRPRNSIKEIYFEAERLGKTVVICSDIYYSENMLKGILQKNGYEDFQAYFTPPLCNAVKKDGGLYHKMLEHFSGIKPEEILHIGGIYETDILAAGNCGIRTFYLPSAVSAFRQQFPVERYCANISMDTDNCFLAGYAANLLFDDPFVTYDIETIGNGEPDKLAVILFAPILVEFILWMQQDMREKGKTELALVYRDGYLPEKLFEIFKVPDITCKRLYLSRFVRYRAKIEEEFSLLSAIKELPIPGLMDISGFIDSRLFAREEKERLLSIIHEKTGKNGDDPLMGLSVLTEVYPELEETYLRRIREGRKPIIEYCRHIIHNPEKTAVFDIGYRGSVVDFLHTEAGLDTMGYHLLKKSFCTHTYGYNNTSSFYEYGMNIPRDTAILHPMLEEVLSIQEGSTIDIRYDAGEYVCLKEETQGINPLIDMMQKAILDYASGFAELFGNMVWQMRFDFSPEIMMLNEFLLSPNQKDACIIKSFNFKDSGFMQSKENCNVYNLWYDMHFKNRN